MSRGLAALLALPAALGLAACGGGTLAAEDVAGAAEDAFEEESGFRYPISCPEDLEAEVGAETRCVLTREDIGQEFGVTVRVRSVEGDRATFDVEVDHRPQG